MMSTDKIQSTANSNLQFEAWLRSKGGNNYTLTEKLVLPTDKFDEARDDGTKKNCQTMTFNAKEEVLRHIRESNQNSQTRGERGDNPATKNSTWRDNSAAVDVTRNRVEAQQNEQRSDMEGSEVITTWSGRRTSIVDQNPVETLTVLQTAIGQTPSGTDEAAQQPSRNALDNSTFTGRITQQPHESYIQYNQPPPFRQSGPTIVTLTQPRDHRSQLGPSTYEEMCRPLRGGPLLPPIRQRAIPIPGKKVEPTTIELYTDTRRDRPRFNLLKQELLNHPDRREAPDSEVDWHVVSQQEIEHLLKTEKALLRQDRLREDACTTIFVVDASFSMREQTMRNLKETIRTYILGNNSHPFVDNIGLVMFGPKVRVVQHLTSDKMLFLSKLDGITTGGMSDLPRALELTSALFVRETRPKFAGLELHPRLFILSDFLISRLRTDDYCGSEPEEMELHLELAAVIAKLREKHNCDIYSVPMGKNPVMKVADQVGYESFGGQLLPVELHKYSKSYIHYNILGHLMARPDERLSKEPLMRVAKELKIDKYVTDKDLDIMMRLARRFDRRRVLFTNREEDPDYVKIAPNLAANQLITGVVIPQERSTDEVIAAIIQDEDADIPEHITDHLPIMPHIGTRVRIGPDFMWRTADITDFTEGKVTQVFDNAPGWLQVKWENGVVDDYRYGLDLEFDVVPVDGDIDGIQWPEGKERLVEDFTFGICDDDPYAGDMIIQLRREIKDYPPMPGYFICQDFPPWPLYIRPRPTSKQAPQLINGLPRFLVEYFTDPDMIPSDDDESAPDRWKINADWLDNLRRKRNREWPQLRRSNQVHISQQNQSDEDDNFSTSQPGDANYYSNRSQQPVAESNSTRQTSLLAQMPISVPDSSRETTNLSLYVKSTINPTILSAQSSVGPTMPLAQNSIKPTPSIKQVSVNASVSSAESSVNSTALSADIGSNPTALQSSFNSASSPVNGAVSPAISRNCSEPFRRSWSQLLNSGSGFNPTTEDTSEPKNLLSSSALFTQGNTEPSIRAPPSTISSPQSAVNSTISSTPTSVFSTQLSAISSLQVPKSNTETSTKSWAQLLNSSAGSNPVNSNNSQPGKPLNPTMQGPPSVISSSHNADTLISSPPSVNPVRSSSQKSVSPTISSEQPSVIHISPTHAEGIHTISSTECSDTGARTWSQLLNSSAGSNLANKSNSNSVIPKSPTQNNTIAVAQPPMSKCETFERSWSQLLNSSAGSDPDSNSTFSLGQPSSQTSASQIKMDENISVPENPLTNSDANTRNWSQLLYKGGRANSVNIDSKPGKPLTQASTEVNHTTQPVGMYGQQGEEKASESQHGLPVQALAGQSETVAKKPLSWSMLLSHNPTTNNEFAEESSSLSYLQKGIPASPLRSDKADTITQNRLLDEALRNSNGNSAVSLGKMAEPSSGAEHPDLRVPNKPLSWSDLLGKYKESPSATLGMSSKNLGLPHPNLGSTIEKTSTDNENTPAEQLSAGTKTESSQDHTVVGDTIVSQSFMRVDLENMSWRSVEQASKVKADQCILSGTLKADESYLRGEATTGQSPQTMGYANMSSQTSGVSEALPSGSTSSFERKQTAGMSNTSNSQPEDQHSRNQRGNEDESSSSDNNIHQAKSATHNELSSVTTAAPPQNTRNTRLGPTGQRLVGQDPSNSVAFNSSHNNSNRDMHQSAEVLVEARPPLQNIEVSKSHNEGQRSKVQGQENRDRSDASHNTSSGDMLETPKDLVRTSVPSLGKKVSRLQPKGQRLSEESLQTRDNSSHSNASGGKSGTPDGSSETNGKHLNRQKKPKSKDQRSVGPGSQTTVGSETSHNNSSVSSESGKLADSVRANARTSHEQVSGSQSLVPRSKSKKASQNFSVGGVPSASRHRPASLHHGGDNTSSVNSQTTELQPSSQQLKGHGASQNFIVSGAQSALRQRPAGPSYSANRPSLNSPGNGSQPVGQRSGGHEASQNSIVNGEQSVAHINVVQPLQNGSDSGETPGGQMDNNPARMLSGSSSSSSSPLNNNSSEMNTPHRRSDERPVYSSDFGPGASAEARWSCPKCTYMNSFSFPFCEMCFEERGLSAGVGSRDWLCPTCTFRNHWISRECLMCGCPDDPQRTLFPGIGHAIRHSHLTQEVDNSANLMQREVREHQPRDYLGSEGQAEGQAKMIDHSESEDQSKAQDRTFRSTDDPRYQGQVMDQSEPEDQMPLNEKNTSGSTLLELSQPEALPTSLTPPGQQLDNIPIPNVVRAETVEKQLTTSLELVRTENSTASSLDTESEESSFEEGTEGSFVWQWQDERGQWRNYAKDVNEKLENTYRHKRGSCVIQHNSLMERVMFKTMKQKNNELKLERNVRRVEIDPKMMENWEKILEMKPQSPR